MVFFHASNHLRTEEQVQVLALDLFNFILTFVILEAFLEHWGIKDLKLFPSPLTWVLRLQVLKVIFKHVLYLSKSSYNSRVPTKLVTYLGILRYDLRSVLDCNEMWNTSSMLIEAFGSINLCFLGFENLIGDPLTIYHRMINISGELFWVQQVHM